MFFPHTRACSDYTVDSSTVHAKKLFFKEKDFGINQTQKTKSYSNLNKKSVTIDISSHEILGRLIKVIADNTHTPQPQQHTAFKYGTEVKCIYADVN